MIIHSVFLNLLNVVEQTIPSFHLYQPNSLLTGTDVTYERESEDEQEPTNVVIKQKIKKIQKAEVVESPMEKLRRLENGKHSSQGYL